MKTFLWGLSLLGFLFGAVLVVASPNLKRPNHVMSATAQLVLTSSNSHSDGPTKAEKYKGVIVSLNGALFILRDDANDTWYHLDDQNTAKKFLGKTVVVTGTLDLRSDMIHVESITEA